VLFEDADVLAVEKPEGLAAIPGGGAKGMPSLMRLLEDLRQNKFYIVHRLDKEVSGVILFAKNAPAHRHLNGQFAGRAVRKTYIALVHGSMGEGIIDRPLREFGSGRVGVDSKRGKPCLTEFKAIRRFTDYTLVEVHPLTGRRHQIRAHFYSEGHPIVGDPLYGNREIQRRYPRLMLHARAIAFELPSGRAVTIESPLPESFHRILEGLGAEDPGSASRRTG
jgi:RluA family pseudouridine synthase